MPHTGPHDTLSATSIHVSPVSLITGSIVQGRVALQFLLFHHPNSQASLQGAARADRGNLQERHTGDSGWQDSPGVAAAVRLSLSDLCRLGRVPAFSVLCCPTS